MNEHSRDGASRRRSPSGGPAASFDLRRQSDGATVTLAASVDNTSGVSVVTLNFTGGSVDFKSVSNGRYILMIDANTVSGIDGKLDGNGDGASGDNYILASSTAPNAPTNIWRLFGDSDGDNDVDVTDFSRFRLAFGNGPSIFDLDGDDDTDVSDFVAFRSRFGTALP